MSCSKDSTGKIVTGGARLLAVPQTQGMRRQPAPVDVHVITGETGQNPADWSRT